MGNWFFFHLDNLDLTLSTTDCHINILLGVSPISKLRYLNGVDSTLQFKMLAASSNLLCDFEDGELRIE